MDLSNNYFKIIHIVSYIYRFIENCRSKVKRGDLLTTSEVNDAETWLIKQDQSGINLSDPSGNLKSLNIFQDDKGILRVGGRLEKASIPYSQKHPAILAKNSKLSKIYFITLHKKLFHVGPQGLLNAVRLRFWALGGRNLARKTVHTCVVCFKCKPIPSSQIMGNLPYERVNMAPPFSITGLDLGGPYFVTYKHQRKGVLNKIYVCVCICFVTRAIHLEILSDLTSDAIIATLKRFMSRVCVGDQTSESAETVPIVSVPTYSLSNRVGNKRVVSTSSSGFLRQKHIGTTSTTDSRLIEIRRMGPKPDCRCSRFS
ncbi:integrase catalytic domain-containing protein [Trichonephila clavipes]|nr:integrase catalytic domain-containing protein [Trichonephila clavipes]